MGSCSPNCADALSAGAVEFCESCGQVCTGECRAEAAFERARARAAYQLPIIR